MKLFPNYKKRSDSELMILIKDGDHRAFSEVYDRYAGKMKAFFYRMLWSDNSMADDFVQDLFTRIIERPELYNSELPLSPWLFRIASNMCKNAYRKKSFEEEYLSQLKQNGVHIPSIERRMDERIIADQLHIVLDTLGEEKKELFLFRYQQQMSINELAILYSTTEGTIKSRLFYIRKILIQSLEGKKIVIEDGKQ